MREETKFRAGQFYVPVTLETENGRIYFHFGYNKILVEEIKSAFEGRKWHGYDDVNPRKLWSVPITQRNLFQIECLKGKYGNDPYKHYDQDYRQLIPHIRSYTELRKTKPYEHQFESIAHGLAMRRFIWSEEMGLGKTLAAFILMELSQYLDWWWIGSKSALREVQSQAKYWKLKLNPRFMTYEGLKSQIANWVPGMPAPRGVIFDEGHNIKTPSAQRSIAARHLTTSMRDEYGVECFIGLLSGSPAPKSPADWWHLCEVVCPGFLREANQILFKNRLALIEEKQNEITGGVYPHLVTWLDDENKCAKCGKLKTDMIHSFDVFSAMVETNVNKHDFVKSVNEVAYLYKRMKGLVLTKFKKDCLDLPDRVYITKPVKPTRDMMRAYNLIVGTGGRAIEVLTRCRELSDGFQYIETQDGVEQCPTCKGTNKVKQYVDVTNPSDYVDPEQGELGIKMVEDENGIWKEVPCTYELIEGECMTCNGDLTIPKYIRTFTQVASPKDELLREDLELHEDVGRLVVFGAFQATIDRITQIVLKEGWTVVVVDGRGWRGMTPTGETLENDSLLYTFQYDKEKYPKVCFIGAAGSAGEGLNLSASPTIIFYSNGFNGKDRMQAEHRGHRPGMDVVRGGRIVDYTCLPTDMYVLENLKKKKDLQALTMTGLREGLQHVSIESEEG